MVEYGMNVGLAKGVSCKNSQRHFRKHGAPSIVAKRERTYVHVHPRYLQDAFFYQAPDDARVSLSGLPT